MRQQNRFLEKKVNTSTLPLLKFVTGACVSVVCLAIFGASGSISSKRAKVESRQSNKPLVAITQIPPQGGGPDVMAPIAGTVRGVNVKNHRVVIFARTNTWYVQPYAASPYTTIRANGKWATRIHLGDEYAALLVENSYQPPATTDELPEVGGSVLAIARVAARERPPASSSKARSSTPRKEESSKAGVSTATRKIQFSGYTWKVKSSVGQVGPGPNYFSDSRENVAVDSRGRLHLRITKRDGRWYCVEVISVRSFGYGTYRFYLDSDFDNVDSRVVLGMFTWSDDPTYSHREIDVEISRWGNMSSQNAQFVVQPYTLQSNIVRFELPSQVKSSLHSFLWKEGSVYCQSRAGADLGTAPIVHEHTFTSNIPRAGNENARINLWLVAGELPAEARETEIVVSRFEFVPLK